MSTADGPRRGQDDYGLVAGDDEQGVTERTGADPAGQDYGLVADRDDVDTSEAGGGAAAATGTAGDEDYGLVPSTVDTDELDDERAAGEPDDAPDTAAYDGTTVDHGSTPGQRGSGHAAG